MTFLYNFRIFCLISILLFSASTFALAPKTRPLSTTVIITIDGTGASGKGTVGKRLAAELGYMHIDTGAVFRTITYIAYQDMKNQNFPQKDILDRTEEELVIRNIKNRLLSGRESFLSDLRNKIQITLLPSPKKESPSATVICNNREMTEQILRSREVNTLVPYLAQYDEIQKLAHTITREAILGKKAVIDGRGLGNVIYKDIAAVKLYFDASQNEEESAMLRTCRLIYRYHLSRLNTPNEKQNFIQTFGTPESLNYTRIQESFPEEYQEEKQKLTERDQSDRLIHYAPLSFDPDEMIFINTAQSPDQVMKNVYEALYQKTGNTEKSPALKTLKESLLSPEVPSSGPVSLLLSSKSA